MIWVTVIFGLLGLLLTWLKSAGYLSPEQKQRLNNLIFRAREVEGSAVGLGCTPGGTPGEAGLPLESFVSSLPPDPEGMRSAIIAGIDKALAHTWVVRGDDARMLSGQRAYWLAAGSDELQKLISVTPT